MRVRKFSLILKKSIPKASANRRNRLYRVVVDQDQCLEDYFSLRKWVAILPNFAAVDVVRDLVAGLPLPNQISRWAKLNGYWVLNILK